jgi:hypothetical protein
MNFNSAKNTQRTKFVHLARWALLANLLDDF